MTAALTSASDKLAGFVVCRTRSRQRVKDPACLVTQLANVSNQNRADKRHQHEESDDEAKIECQ